MAKENAKKKNNKKTNNVASNKKATTKKVNSAPIKKEVKKEVKKEEALASDTKKVTTETVKVEKKEKEKKEFKLTTRQKDLILILLVIVLFGVALALTCNRKSAPSYFSQINYSEYEEKISSGDTFMVVILRDGCSYCQKYEPILKKVSRKYEYPVYFIDIADLSEEEFNMLSEGNAYLNSNDWGTPTTLLMNGNEVIDSISGYVEEDEVVKFITKNNLVNENE